MQFLKRNSIVIVFIVGSVFYSLSLAATVKNIIVNDLSIVQDNKDIFVDFDQEIYLTSKMINGLKNGIILVFDINFILTKDTPYWFDDIILVKKSQYKIKYRNLLEKFEVVDINGEKLFFKDLPAALKYLKIVKKWYVGTLNEKEKKLLASLRIQLNKNHLPKPLQINIKDKIWDFQSEEITKYIEVNN
ncbi:MAG: DUF4390 domain-containing protein [Methylophilaceae bacterium]|tara:strand:+ start:1133 stop:1699 length:567 start_codon:yes stop_codon:yes gene_type:complete